MNLCHGCQFVSISELKRSHASFILIVPALVLQTLCVINSTRNQKVKKQKMNVKNKKRLRAGFSK